MRSKFGKNKGGAPTSKTPPAERAPEPEDDLMAEAKTSPPSKKRKQKASGGGGGGIIKLLIPLLLIVGLAAGSFYVYTNYLGGDLGGGLPGLSTDNAAPESDGGSAAQPPSEPLPDAQAQESPPEQTLPDTAEQAPPAGAENVVPLPDEPADGASALRAESGASGQIDCTTSPKFLEDLGLTEDYQISTSEPGVRGLILIGASQENSDAPSRYQHQSWSRAGFLDAFVGARNGDVYFAPSPRTGLGIDSPQNQDHIYKLDTNSGELVDFATLPSAAPSTPEFPFGIVGLAFDCETNGLYASTIMGSTPDSQVGRIYHIDLNTGEIVGQIENVDAYGLAVRAASNGSQLLFGSTRDNQIRAQDLNGEGNFQGEPRTVATMADSQRARGISISNGNEMVVQAVEFNYANAEIPQGTLVRLQYDGASDTWVVAE